MADEQVISSNDGRATAEPSSEVTAPERWEAVATDIERQQVTTACRRLEQDSSLSDAQRAVVERLAATIVERLSPGVGQVLVNANGGLEGLDEREREAREDERER